VSNDTVLVLVVITALAFDFTNGFHDTGNAMATSIATGALPPRVAAAISGVLNFVGAFLSLAVAATIASGLVATGDVTLTVVAAGLAGGIIWNLLTWLFGIPSSSSHALIGGLAGAALAKAGFAGITFGKKWIQTLTFIGVSPLLGAAMGFLLMLFVFNAFQHFTPAKVDRVFRRGQLLSSALLSLSHGGNDAQKTMGVIVGLLASAPVQAAVAGQTGILHHLYVPSATVTPPLWVEATAYLAISLGTLFGGWRIVHTMGSRITRLRPVGGFCAETGGGLVILLASHFGIPVSTTHTITGSIVGVGATNRLSAVRWGLAGRIVWAWVLTIPAAALFAAVSFWILRAVVPLQF